MPRNILVVEDSFEINALLLRVLSGAGFEVRGASSNLEAMEALRTFEPDLVITDCFLGGAGPLFVPVIREFRKRVPILVLSGDPIKAKRLLPDADEVVGKPVALQELIQKVVDLLDSL